MKECGLQISTMQEKISSDSAEVSLRLPVLQPQGNESLRVILKFIQLNSVLKCIHLFTVATTDKRGKSGLKAQLLMLIPS